MLLYCVCKTFDMFIIQYVIKQTTIIMVKVLITNSFPGHTATTILYKEHKFKISCENGYCYSHLKVEMYCSTGLSFLANEYDIPGYKRIADYSDNDGRVIAQEENVKHAIEYIKAIF